jgi:sarcosine oxidase subunit gamma
MTISEITGFGLIAIMARKGIPPAAIGARLGMAAPPAPRWTSNEELTMIGTGPGTWFARIDTPAPDWTEALADQLAGIASVTDVSDSYRVFRIAGGTAGQLLRRGVFIDLHPAAFATGSVAITVIAHIGVILRQLDELPTYEIAVFRSTAESFRHWLATQHLSLPVRLL